MRNEPFRRMVDKDSGTPVYVNDETGVLIRRRSIRGETQYVIELPTGPTTEGAFRLEDVKPMASRHVRRIREGRA